MMDDNSFLTLFQKYKHPIFLGVFLLVLGVTLGVRWISSREGSLERDFAYARELAHQLGTNHKGVPIADFEGIIHRHHELEAQYDGQLAQYWIKDHNPEAASPYIQRIARRTQKQSPLYTELAQGTLLISKGQLDEALEQTQTLQSTLSEKENPLLSAYLLLRCALLQEELEFAEAQSSWQALIVLLDSRPKETRQIQTALREGKISLTDYAKTKISSE